MLKFDLFTLRSDLLPHTFVWALYIYMGKMLRKHILDISLLSNFHKITNGAFCQKGLIICLNGCHAYMVKTLKNLLLQNQESFKAESWYIALGTQALLILFK